MEKIIAGLVIVAGGICVIAGISLLIAFPIKWTWNYTMPYLFGWPMLTWGKAWCLSFLCSWLLKSNSTAPAKG